LKKTTTEEPLTPSLVTRGTNTNLFNMQSFYLKLKELKYTADYYSEKALKREIPEKTPRIINPM